MVIKSLPFKKEHFYMKEIENKIYETNKEREKEDFFSRNAKYKKYSVF